MSELPEESATVEATAVETTEAESATDHVEAVEAEPADAEADEAVEPEVIDADAVGAEAVEPEAPEAVDPVEVVEEIMLEADPVLLASREVARGALAEITDAQTIGADEGHEVHEQHVLTLYFECRLPGYPGWRWAATLSRVDEDSPVNVLEVELLPGAGAVTAPEWVPWSVRLAQYRETQARQAAEEAVEAEAAAAELSEEDDVEADEDVLENDFSDFDDEIDGVDLDEDDSDDDESDDDDDSDDEDEDDEADEDGFTEMAEHDLHDHSHEEVDCEHDEEE